MGLNKDARAMCQQLLDRYLTVNDELPPSLNFPRGQIADYHNGLRDMLEAELHILLFARFQMICWVDRQPRANDRAGLLRRLRMLMVNQVRLTRLDERINYLQQLLED